MRPATRWERFKRHFIWGQWSWRTFGVYRWAGESTVIVVGKLKIVMPKPRVSGDAP